MEALLGAPTSPGGRHPGLGTRNALLGLGPGCYLEVVGVDPDQPPPGHPRWFDLDRLDGPRLVTWAARHDDLDGVVRRGRAAGVALGEPREASRTRPDGSELRWTFTDPFEPRAGGVLPFFIAWGATAHPGRSLPAACSLVDLVGLHPRAPEVEGAARALGLPLKVRPGTRAGLEATLRTPRGIVVLR